MDCCLDGKEAPQETIFLTEMNEKYVSKLFRCILVQLNTKHIHQHHKALHCAQCTSDTDIECNKIHFISSSGQNMVGEKTIKQWCFILSVMAFASLLWTILHFEFCCVFNCFGNHCIHMETSSIHKSLSNPALQWNPHSSPRKALSVGKTIFKRQFSRASVW